mmetsp:Transcript_5250/g.8128  ORF Transcript_5250/g.8128 Transcript_5250/m.8128 type:complete len:101 (+) Transcript_5250:110-412(+)|eukprot:CAMPEP_0170504036 /NCGR_PEP_ID=MMETSP0208-20121228/46664_1 /TAXON_ID=197538 /ORGANISM="Strombidium inclinatum, Strain S3" /LENGTH=100 /DNA_ID=CAMNT_0010784047 /DNA_START=133 /DNA_END=435 /DNA_ORIENTATION=-
MNNNIDNRLANNDEDFMAAYRGHMQMVERELESLKAKTNESEFIMKKDERVKKLEAQMAWFREEALVLQVSNKKLMEEITEWKSKCEDVEEEKKYMEALR